MKHFMEGGWLKTRPRIGTEVATLPEARAGDLLKPEVEQLFVEAQRVRLDLAEVVHAVEVQWAKTGKPNSSHGPELRSEMNRLRGLAALTPDFKICRDGSIQRVESATQAELTSVLNAQAYRYRGLVEVCGSRKFGSA